MNLITSICHHPLRLRCDVAVTPSPSRAFMEVKSSSFPFYPRRFLDTQRVPFVAFAKKKNSQPEPVLKPSIIEEVYMDDDDDDDDEIEDDDFEDEMMLDDDGDFDDKYFEEEAEPCVGDGAGGGGISLAGTGWDKKAREICEEVALSFDGELGIYAFKTMLNATVQVRIERLTNKTIYHRSGSPNLTDIEEFSRAYRARLDEAESMGSIPANISLEVSSPGVERVLRIPQDLDRFKDRNMYVKYATEVVETGTISVYDGVFRLISFDQEASFCTWGLADVRVNREKAGKGRPLNKKQRDWRLDTPFDSLRLVRLYSEA